MAADEQVRSEFTEILSATHRKFDIIHTRWIYDKQFEVKFRTQISPDCDDFNGLCDEWVDLFSEITNTVWAKKTSNTGPKIRFRKQYQCWTHGGKVIQKELLFDARRCKGTLDMKVLTDNPYTRKKNKHIRMGLNVVVKINFVHLHKVDTQQKYSCFVHNCEPQDKAPEPNIRSNDKLPKLVADMVQKGLNSTGNANNSNSTSNASNSNTTLITDSSSHNQLDILDNNSDEFVSLESTTESLNMPDGPHIHDDEQVHVSNIQVQNMEPTFQFNQILPFQNVEGIKLELQSQFPQVTQLLVSEAPLEMGESILVCQPTIMFDPSQMIPVPAHSLQPHFIQLQPHNIHNQQTTHYL